MSETFYGSCRCCLAEGPHRDIKKEYFSNGVAEIYYDMFVSCFNLQLSESTNNNLICHLCIQQLRDASAFRSKVVKSEEHLIKTVTFNGTLYLEVPPLEQEKPLDIKLEKEDDDDIKQESYTDDEDSVPLIHHKSNPPDDKVEGEEALLARFPAGSLAPLPTRCSLYTTLKAYVMHLDSLKGKVIPTKDIVKSMKPSNLTNKKIYMTEKLAHVTNVCTLLENSNVTPFKSKIRSGFPCYYCCKICENLQALKEHQKEESKGKIRQLLKKYGVEGLVIYVDITDLKCTICDLNLDSLNMLKEHLKKEHNKKWYDKLEDRVIPFKLTDENNFECQICKFAFETFGSVERHMNIHYRNYVCEDCGSGFVTKLRLKVHFKTVHKAGTFPCEKCNKIFNTAQKFRTHIDSVHKMVKKNKCPKCPERFAEYFKRQKHMVEVHGLAPLLYRCNVCDKSYNRRYHLSCHMKRCHLNEKEIQCQFCAYMCYTKSELTNHMVKHNNSRSFECAVCKKSYARKKTLKEHMRIHNNDRRFSCTVCGQAFVQNCSLKGHIKTHHPELAT